MKDFIEKQKEGFLRHYNRMDKRQGMQVGRVNSPRTALTLKASNSVAQGCPGCPGATLGIDSVYSMNPEDNTKIVLK